VLDDKVIPDITISLISLQILHISIYIKHWILPVWMYLCSCQLRNLQA